LYIPILIFGYLLGSIPTGYLVGKWLSQIDLRQIGSGSTGATNVFRHVGRWPALGVFIFDVSKGILPIFVAKGLLLNISWQVAAGLAAVIGHIWPIWLKGKGGKAVATGLGIFLGLSWQVGMACFGVFLIVLSISKIVSLSSIVSALCLPLIMYIHFKSDDYLSTYLTISSITMVMVLWRHRTNIARLIRGEEPKINQAN